MAVELKDLTKSEENYSQWYNDLVIKAGARPAEPGEFTKRAFLNGKMDLSQAEAVIDVINAKTDKEAKISLEQLEGNLSEKISNIRKIIISVMADIEATIDYPEYDLEEVTNAKILKILDEVDIIDSGYARGDKPAPTPEKEPEKETGAVAKNRCFRS